MNEKRMQEIREKTKQVLAHAEEVDRRLKEMKNPLQLRDVLCIWGFPDDAIVYYACVTAHPDDKDMFFFVPIDHTDFMIGICDVQAGANFFFEKWVARCNFGFWASRDCFSIRDICTYPDAVDCMRTGVLDEQWHSEIRKKLAGLARGKIEGSQKQQEEEANPDYEDWQMVVGTAVEKLTNKLRFA